MSVPSLARLGTFKTCTKCGCTKPSTTEYFSPCSSYRSGFRSQCIICRRMNSRRYKRRNPGYTRSYREKTKQANAERVYEGVKVCKECGRERPATPEFFYRDNAKKDGLQNKCKECKNNYFASWKAVPDNWSRFLEQSRERLAERRRTDPEYDRIVGKRYRATVYGKAMGKLRASRRRALLLGNGGSHTSAEIEALYEVQEGQCEYCGCGLADDYHRDHRIPVSRGGSDNIENIALTCPPCNFRKNDLTDEEFREEMNLSA